jgi:CheY-like chemotaxis protein
VVHASPRFDPPVWWSSKAWPDTFVDNGVARLRPASTMTGAGDIQASPSSAAGADRERVIGVLVVDDQASFRRVARAVVDTTAGFAALAEAGSGHEALVYADELRPDLVLMDVNMPDMDGLEAARRLTDAHRSCVVVLVSIEALDDLPREVDSCGAAGFLPKQQLRPATLRAVWERHGRLA